MKPQFSPAGPLLLAALVPAFPATAAEISRADVPIADYLNVPASWIGGAVPTAVDTAVFDGNSATAANNQNRLGGDMAWAGIRVLNPQAVNVTSGYIIAAQTASGVHTGTLTLGAGGVDLSNAVAPPAATLSFFSISCALTLSADQPWNVPDVGAVNDLLLSGSSSRPVQLNGRTITKTGNGRLAANGSNLFSNGTVDVQEGELNFVSTLNTAASSSAVLTVGPDVTVRLRPGTAAGFGRAAGAGDVRFSGVLEMQDATLNLHGFSDYPGDLTLNGQIALQGGSENFLTNSNPKTTASVITTTVAAALRGTGALSVQISTSRPDDRLLLTGDNSDYSGRLSVDGTSGNRTLVLAATPAGSAAAQWHVSSGNTLEIAAADVPLGTLTGSGSLTGTASGSGVQTGAGTFSGPLSSAPGASLHLTKNTSGTLTLSGPRSGRGDTVVEAGTLVINGDHSGTDGTVTVAAGGTLGGNGLVGDVIVDGTLAPGDGIGTLRAISLTLQPGAVLDWGLADWNGPLDFSVDSVSAGSAAITATPAQPLVIRLQPQGLVNFTQTARTFRLIATGTAITGLDLAAVTVDAGAFPAATGTWSIVAGAGGTALDLVYTPPVLTNPYISWASTNGLTGAASAASADPDGDGVSNALEFIFGSQPNPDRPGAPSAHLLPEASADATHLILTWRQSAAASSFSAVNVETSADLSAPWQGIVPGANGVTRATEADFYGPGLSRVTVRIPLAGGTRFARLRVDLPIE